MDRIMTNEEKRQYILGAYDLMMKYHVPNNDVPITLLKKLDDENWKIFSKTFLLQQPRKLYRYYRVDNSYTIKNFSEDLVWFSHPNQFNDSVDSSININVSEELEYLNTNIDETVKLYTLTFLDNLLKTYNINCQECCECYYNGKIDEKLMFNFLINKIPIGAVFQCIERIKSINNSNNYEILKHEIAGFLKSYTNFNDRIKSEVLTLCLSEQGNNNAMWGLYANGSRGFCVQYEIPYDEIKSQRLRSNLMPIYYGERDHISLSDMMYKSVFCKDRNMIVNGIHLEDYKRMISSMYTKDPCWQMENEWRITLSNHKNLVVFPYASAIILGERMTEENKNKLINIATKKQIDIYERRLTRCSSSVKEFKIN